MLSNITDTSHCSLSFPSEIMKCGNSTRIGWVSDNRRALAISPALRLVWLFVWEKAGSNDGAAASNTLMINDNSTKSYLYGSEHVAKKNDEKCWWWHCSSTHDILVADEHLPPSNPLELVCVKTLYLCVSKPCTHMCQNTSFVFISSLPLWKPPASSWCYFWEQFLGELL